ncbi:MAG TPA: histidine--tRNA ligase [Cyanobacteria bacterium UBA8530]|nr:histidine--tRNA ligase [Cyanobacteria bacterium UBA8530]
MEKQVSLPRGTKDILPDEVQLWQRIEATAAVIFGRCHCSEIRTPIFEATELYARGIGEATDIVSKEMYTFIDRGERSVTLRPEGTAGVVRAFIQNKMFALPGPQKLWYSGPMFRYERPQAGRQRQFNQIGMEIFGTSSPKADAEAILVSLDIFEALGVQGLEVQINSLGCPDCRGNYRKALVAFFENKKEEYCSDCQSRVELNPLRVLDCKVPACKALNQDAPSIQETLCEGCREHQKELLAFLDSVGTSYRLNPKLVRGLDYYTRTVFEVVSGSLGSQNTLCGGGRYDNLVEECGGPPTPAVGWSFGVERLVMILGGKGNVLPLDLFVASLGEAAERKAFELAHGLRKSGLSVETDFSGGKLDKQIKQAIRLNAKFLLILGEDELARGECLLKNLSERSQGAVPLEGAVEAIAGLVK